RPFVQVSLAYAASRAPLQLRASYLERAPQRNRWQSMAIEEPQAPASDILLVHSSDLHVDDERISAQHNGDGTAGLRAVLATAREFGADIVLLAGDTFDNHMVTAATIDRAGEVLAKAGLPVVILPGNHDPVSADSVYVRGGFAAIPNLRILGMTHDRAVQFPRSEERRVGKECRSRWSG